MTIDDIINNVTAVLPFGDKSVIQWPWKKKSKTSDEKSNQSLINPTLAKTPTDGDLRDIMTKDEIKARFGSRDPDDHADDQREPEFWRTRMGSGKP
tara:strand:+ start:70 stop:357 length:288 start_codon:yes stop_codon:yes gene_type:complete